MLNGNITCYKVHGQTAQQKLLIYAYLQGAVYCWCKNHPNQWFGTRDLVGGDNFYWQGTPAYPVYEYYASFGFGNYYAITEAGKAIGRLLKRVIIEDKRTFETRSGYRTRQYLWTGAENDSYHPLWLT